MPTTPFTGAFISRLEEQIQGYQMFAITGEVVHFKLFCCANPPDLGITKSPVPVLNIDPDEQCLGQAITADGLQSYTYPGYGIAAYSFDWGDGTAAAVGAGPHNHTYAEPGIYTIELTVTDTQVPAETGSVRSQVLIVECDRDTVLIEQMYALSQTAGTFVRDTTVLAPDWEQRIGGMEGDWLHGRDIKLDPHRRQLRFGLRHVWIATEAGPAKSLLDMRYWKQLYDRLPEPRNDAADAPAPTKAMLDFFCITFNPMSIDEVYLLAGLVNRLWVYWTYDGGRTWDNWQVRY